MLSPGKVYYGHNTDIYVIDSTLVPKYTWNKCEISTVYSWNRFNVNRTYTWNRYDLDVTYVWNEYELACDWDSSLADVEYDRHSDSFGGRIWGTIGTSYTLYANHSGTIAYAIDSQYEIYSTTWEDTVTQVSSPSYCSNCDRGGLDPIVNYTSSSNPTGGLYKLEISQSTRAIKRTRMHGKYQSAKAGSYIGQKTSKSEDAYPDGGVYIPSGSTYGNTYTALTDPQYERGDYDRQVTSSSSSAYPNNGQSGSYWYVSAGSTTSKGSANGSVTSTNASAYPADGASGNYWYTSSGSTQQAGTVLGTVESYNSSAYPDNGILDGYWYVKQ